MISSLRVAMSVYNSLIAYILKHPEWFLCTKQFPDLPTTSDFWLHMLLCLLLNITLLEAGFSVYLYQ